MLADLTSLFPRWVLWGVGLGAVATGLVALAFYLGDRFAPPSVAETGDRRAAGDERRRREIHAYLTAADERFDEDHPFGGVTVPFYLPERDVAITFDAHDYFRLEGKGVYTVLCEHEMPGRGLGRRLPFDVAEPDWDADQGNGSGAGRSGPEWSGPAGAASGRRDPVGDAFDELGVARGADLDAVKRAYRERAKETHPDQGGDEEAFRRVREAYATARNHAGGGRGGTRTGTRAPRSDADREGDRRREHTTGFGR